MLMYRLRGQYSPHENYLLGTKSNEAERKLIRRPLFDKMTPSKVVEKLNMFPLQPAAVHQPPKTNLRLMTVAGEKIH